MSRLDDTRPLQVEEPRHAPFLALVLGYGPMLPFVLALVMGVFGGAFERAAYSLAQFWGAALLLFFAGVRRGLSFRTPGGPSTPQIATMMALFFGGVAVLLMPVIPSLLVLAASFAALGVLDPLAAQREDAPAFFARLRPVQMTIPVISLVGLVAIAA